MEKMAYHSSPSPEQQAIDRTANLKTEGEQALRKINIEPNDYLAYTELMQQADAPIGQALGVLDYLDGVIITPAEAVEAWTMIKNIFDQIDTDKYDQVTGQNFLVEMKQLVTDCLELLKELDQKYGNQEITERIKLPDQLLTIKNRITELKQVFGQLPAYLTYRQVGIYDINPNDIPNDIWFRERPTKSTN